MKFDLEKYIDRAPTIFGIILFWGLLLLIKSIEIPSPAVLQAQAAAQAAKASTALSTTTTSAVTSTVAITPTIATTETAVAVAQALPPGDAAKGKEVYAGTCAACHGPTGEGVKGLGKDLTTSTFVTGLSDAELLAFVKKGRDVSDPLNTTKIMMPPKGGNPALDDASIMDVIAFIRSIHK